MTLGIFQSEEKDKYTHENSENKQTIAGQLIKRSLKAITTSK